MRRTAPVKTHGLTHVALAVRNPQRSLAFYQAVLGVVSVYEQRDFVQAQTPGSRDVLVFERKPHGRARPVASRTSGSDCGAARTSFRRWPPSGPRAVRFASTASSCRGSPTCSSPIPTVMKSRSVPAPDAGRSAASHAQGCLVASSSTRTFVASIAAKEPQRAFELARGIDDAWFRCQALSMAALHLADSKARARAIDEALAAASELTEPNRVVSVSAWPVKVLAIQGRFDCVASEVDWLLAVIATEGSPVRRADALRALFGAVIHAKRPVILRVVFALESASFQPLLDGRRNRKGESLLADCLPAIARIDERVAESLLARLPATRADRTREDMQSMATASLDFLAPWPNVGG